MLLVQAIAALKGPSNLANGFWLGFAQSGTFELAPAFPPSL